MTDHSIASGRPAARLADVLGRSPRVLEVMDATIGGTRRHLVALATGLRAAGFDVEVAAPRVRDEAFGDTAFVPLLERAGVPVHCVPMTRAIRPGGDLRALLRLAALMRRGSYDVVHTHSSKAGLLGRLAARLARAPVTVHTPHGFYFLNYPPGSRRSFYLALEQIAGAACDAVIAVSEGERLEAIRAGVVPAEKVTVIRNGIALGPLAGPFDAAAVRQELGVASGAPVVGTVARFTRQKAPERFLRAAAIVARQRPDAVFVWCGDGELRSQVEVEAERLGVLPRLRLLGFRPDVYRILAAYDVFVLLSRFEGLAYTPLEAMALRKPVVASDIAGLRDVVVADETGFLVPDGSPAEAAAHVLRLLADPCLAERMGMAGQQRVARCFDEEETVQRTGHLYAGLLLSARLREASRC